MIFLETKLLIQQKNFRTSITRYLNWTARQFSNGRMSFKLQCFQECYYRLKTTKVEGFFQDERWWGQMLVAYPDHMHDPWRKITSILLSKPGSSYLVIVIEINNTTTETKSKLLWVTKNNIKNDDDRHARWFKPDSSAFDLLEIRGPSSSNYASSP